MGLLERVQSAFELEKIPFALVGGYAVALLGAPRGTVDIDFIIRHTLDDFVRCEKALRSIGLLPRLPVTASEIFEFREEYTRKRNLIAWTFVNHANPIEIVDIIITTNLAEVKTVSRKLGLTKIKVISIDDLIRMKTATGRPQDEADIRVLEQLRANKT
jgi:hypothetical protein